MTATEKRALILGLLTLLASCGPPRLSPQEVAALDARLSAQKAREAQEKSEFEADVISRTASDKRAPARVHDPGYPVGECRNPKESHVSAVKAPVPISEWSVWGGIVCDNTTAGLTIIAWREWYCKAIEPDLKLVRQCVIGSWHRGYVRAKHYGGIVTTAVAFGSSANAVQFGPSKWQPGPR